MENTKVQYKEEVLVRDKKLSFESIEALFDSHVLNSLLSYPLKNKLSQDGKIKYLFEKNKLVFYINSSKTFLTSNCNELMANDFGNLTPISGWIAYKKYGIEKLNEAKEKGYVKL